MTTFPPKPTPSGRDRLVANRKARIEAEVDPVERERLETLDAACGAVDQAVGLMLAVEAA